jgi:hypothetical protein
MLAYCDYISTLTTLGLKSLDAEAKIKTIGYPEMDLHPTQGYMISTKRTITVQDTNGKQYRITVEEV